MPTRTKHATTPTCTCERPLPEERAVRKGVSETYCRRCGLRLAASIRRWR